MWAGIIFLVIAFTAAVFLIGFHVGEAAHVKSRSTWLSEKLSKLPSLDELMRCPTCGHEITKDG